MTALVLVNHDEEHPPVEGEVIPQLPNRMIANSVDDWNQGAADCVRTSIFPKKQFLVSDADLDMGGSSKNMWRIIYTLQTLRGCKCFGRNMGEERP